MTSVCFAWHVLIVFCNSLYRYPHFVCTLSALLTCLTALMGDPSLCSSFPDESKVRKGSFQCVLFFFFFFTLWTFWNPLKSITPVQDQTVRGCLFSYYKCQMKKFTSFNANKILEGNRRFVCFRHFSISFQYFHLCRRGTDGVKLPIATNVD